MRATHRFNQFMHLSKVMIRKTPVIGSLAINMRRKFSLCKGFPGSKAYWEDRYVKGGTSGAGSYNRLARFKAEVINEFVRDRRLESVIEFGSGDGNQLRLANYKHYVGFDVSATAIEACRSAFAGDASKAFKLTDEYAGETADLTLSLDVIYHLVEDPVFELYMGRLFDSAKKFVIIYSSNDASLNERYGGGHVRHRTFTEWVSKNSTGWIPLGHLPNKYPYRDADPDETSFADFYFFERQM